MFPGRDRTTRGLGNELITPATAAAGGIGVRCRDRLSVTVLPPRG